MTERVGYIGLGIMGRPAALNLMAAGYPLRVWARRAESMTPLLEAGAEPASSPADVAEESDIVFINVSDTPDVEAVIIGDGGVIHGAQRGSVVVDMSTIFHPTARKSDALR